MGLVFVKVKATTDADAYFYGNDILITGKVSASALGRLGVPFAQISLFRDVGLGMKHAKNFITRQDGVFEFVDTTMPWLDAGETKEMILENGITFQIQATVAMILGAEETLPRVVVNP